MSNLMAHAKRELDIIGMTEDSGECNLLARESILQIAETFSKQGHSGFSASYVISTLEKILRFEPLAPLMGDDSEWTNVGDGYYQNKRCYRVFKEEDGRPYDIEGKVFWEWVDRELEPDEDGYPGNYKYKLYYTNKDSLVYIDFPYTPNTVYEERVSS